MTDKNGRKYSYLPNSESSPDARIITCIPYKRCRLCISTDEGMVPIFNEEGKRLELAYKINKLLPTMVAPLDMLPQEVCRKCITKLTAAYEFVKKCMLTQARLRKLAKTVNCYESIEAIQNYSSHWSQGDENGANQRECHKRRLQEFSIPTKEGNIGETERGGQFKKIKLDHDSNYQTKIIANKTFDNTDMCEVENILPNSSVSISSVGCSIDSDSMRSKKNCSPIKEGDVEETERNGQLKKFQLAHVNEHQSQIILNKTLDNTDMCEVETILPDSNVNISSDGGHVGSDLVTENISIKAEVLNVATSENNLPERCTSKENIVPEFWKYLCKYCDRGFPWKADLFDHQTSVHSDLVFRCSYCMKVFYERDALESHELAHSKLIPPGYKMKKNLQIHSGKNKGERLVLQHSDEINELKPLMESEKSDASNSVNSDDKKEGDKECSYCKMTFTSVKMQRKHMKSEHHFRLTCRFCPMTCPSINELNRHESTHRKKPKKCVFCKKCGKNYESLGELREHDLIHLHKDGLKCEICGEAFLSEVSLEEHINIHGGESIYLCETCGQNFESFFEFRAHKMTHIYRDILKCGFCNTYMHDVVDLESHLEVVHKKKKITCKICQKVFVSSELFKEHKAMHRNTEFKCESCNKTFTSAKKLRNHAQTHSSERNYLCEKCGKDFKLNSSLHKHRYLCQVAVSCSVCSRKFDCTTRLRIHMRIHTGEKPHVCAACGKGFHATWALNQHMLTHNTVKVPCPICGTLFNRKANMLTHMMRHRVPCDTCGQVFANTPLLVAHQKLHVENGERPADQKQAKSYKCNECGKLFVTSLDLKSHIPSHSNDCPHTCSICNKSFRRPKSLKKHMVIHGGSKPYQCRYCTCTFVVHQRLLKHEKGHTAGKPYVCEVCGQGFWSPLNLEKHSLKHSAAGPTGQKFNCNYCEKSFAYKSSLIIHKRTHSAQLTYSCPFCPRKFSQLRFMQRHKCALNPNLEGSESSLQKGSLQSPPTLTKEPSSGGDKMCPPSVLNEEIVYDMDYSGSYAEIIVISQNLDEFIDENNST